VLDQARRLGVLQVHFSGGEPLVRPGLAGLVGHAAALGMYTNLVTSGVPLRPGALEALAAAGLDHVQLSIQDADAARSDAIAGTPSFERKLSAAAEVRRLALALTVNVVLHRANIDAVERIVDLAARLAADRLELANAQYYGWALRNRAALMPTSAQIEALEPRVQAARDRHPAMEIVYVLPDYFEQTPKPCMHGWASRQLTVTPGGDVLPCAGAAQIPDLGVQNVLQRPLADIWYSSPAFNRFRGTDWMPQPCAGCPRKEIDFGGCRCQAFQLTGDAAATDPVCHLSPRHELVTRLVNQREPADGAYGADAPEAWVPRPSR
jgi:pyrroloquinoline quinone biosynthesis protein E